MELYGFENTNLLIEGGFLEIGGIPGAAGATGFSPMEAPPPAPSAAPSATPAAATGAEGMGFWGNMGTGLAVAGLFGGASALSQNSTNNALTGVARTNAGLWESVSQSNRETLKTLTETNANASNDMTRWQVMGMIFNANTQYLQSVEITNNMDRANRRAFFTERKQMYGESKMMTLAHNATIHADNLDQDRQMTKMEYDFQERVAAATTTTTG